MVRVPRNLHCTLVDCRRIETKGFQIEASHDDRFEPLPRSIIRHVLNLSLHMKFNTLLQREEVKNSIATTLSPIRRIETKGFQIEASHDDRFEPLPRSIIRHVLNLSLHMKFNTLLQREEVKNSIATTLSPIRRIETKGFQIEASHDDRFEPLPRSIIRHVLNLSLHMKFNTLLQREEVKNSIATTLSPIRRIETKGFQRSIQSFQPLPRSISGMFSISRSYEVQYLQREEVKNSSNDS